MTKEEARNNLYNYIEKNLKALSNSNRTAIKKLVIEHDKAESKADTKATEKISFLQGKISHYLAKASKLQKTERIAGNIEALELCKKWLSE
jgi:hypothetical protein